MNRFIELVNFTNISIGCETVEQIIEREIYSGKRQTFGVCDYSSLQAWPTCCRCCYVKDLPPVYGAVFSVKTPPSCLVEHIDVFCYAKDESGAEDIIRLYNTMTDGKIAVDDLVFYSRSIYVGFYLDTARQLTMLSHIIKNCIMPDFVFINSRFREFDLWEMVIESILEKNIMICATTSSFRSGVNGGSPVYCADELHCCSTDDGLAEAFGFLGERMDSIVFENPRIIAGFDADDEFRQNNDIEDYDVIPPLQYYCRYHCSEVIEQLCSARLAVEFGSADGFVAKDRYRSELEYIYSNNAGAGFLAARAAAQYCRESGYCFSADGIFRNSFAAWLLGILDECPIEPQLHCELFDGEPDFRINVPAVLWKKLPGILNDALSEQCFIYGSEILYEEKNWAEAGACCETGCKVRKGDQLLTDVLVFCEKEAVVPTDGKAGCRRSHFDYRDYPQNMRLMISYLPMQQD